MLVMTIKSGDTIHLDGGIVFEFVHRRGKQMKVGVTAPKEIQIKRVRRTKQPSHEPLPPTVSTVPCPAM